MNKEPSSYKDPDGFIFTQGCKMYRQINYSGKEDYELLMSSGLYNELVKERLLISHKEAMIQRSQDCYKIIQPEKVQFISYPYEWCFSQLKKAALATLRIQKIALRHSMSLKDSSAFNIQFVNCKPLLIDTLSLQKYIEGKPWIAYKQFCEHFLAPLALMSYRDVRLSKLLKEYLDGIPLDLASRLLPARSKFSMNIMIHIHLHAKSQKYFGNKTIRAKQGLSRKALLGIIVSLEDAVNAMKWKPTGEWNKYYDCINYSQKSIDDKDKILEKWIDRLKPKVVWDIGANTGKFSRIASKKAQLTISIDKDYAAVEQNYLETLKMNDKILPLVIDITNPSTNLGWNNNERKSLNERGPADAIIALAIVHHLTISNNIPLPNVAKYFNEIGKNLIVEYAPKTDLNVKKLVAAKEAVHHEYSEEEFEKCFKKYFRIIEKTKIIDSERIMYLMKRISK